MATGTIALQVGDVNDNCPSLTNDVEHICSGTEVVSVTAVDEDGDPNAAPFTFSLVAEESRGEWKVEPANGTTTYFLSPVRFVVVDLLSITVWYQAPD